MRAALFFALILLNGCMTLANPIGPVRISGNENTAIISNLWQWSSDEEIFKAAGAFCANYGKTARYSHSEAGRQIFDCIK